MMRLLHRVVKSSQVYENGNSVFIDNTIVIPVIPKHSDEEELTPEQEELFKAQLEKEERERKISEEVNRQVEILRNQIEIERAELLSKNEKMRESIISDAEKKAQDIIEKANAQYESILKNALEKGYQEGFEKGRDEAISQCDTYVKTAAQFLSEINSKKEAYFLQNEEKLLDISIEMAKKITTEEIKTDKNILLKILEQAAKTFRNSDRLKISFAKGDVSEEVVTDLEFIKKLVGNIPEVEVELLPEAQEGTIILDNDSEIIDASVPTQLELLQEIMKNSKKK